MINLIILNIIYISFPLMIYFLYVIYKNIKNEKEGNLFLAISLFTSLSLSLKYGNVFKDERLLILCNIPIIIAYVKKKNFLGIILSMVIVIYTYTTIKSNIIYVMIIKYVIYYVIALLANKSKKYRLIDLVAIVQGFMLSFEYFFKKTTAEDIYALINIILVVVIFYTITFAILYLFEITDRISNVFLNYKELEQDKQIKNSLFKITHEIKNPLAVLKGYLDMFNAKDIEKSQKYITIMKNEVDRTLNIINDFMELSKIKIEKDILDINLLIYETTDVIKLIFNKKDINLINEIFDEEEVYIMGDYNRLKQVFINLFKNCYEAIENKGIVKISAHIKDDYYIITIFDNGIGMSDETIKNIKHVFYTTKKQGSGVGVTLSNEIIKAHGGTLSYESKLGEYTKTTIKLPILKEGN